MDIQNSNPWSDLPDVRNWVEAKQGLSGARVFRIRRGSEPDLFLKTEEIGPFGELEGEAARLAWLESVSMPAARVLRQARHAGRNWLLMRAVPGRDLSCDEIDARLRIAVLADALRRLHAVPVALCPFDHRAEHRIALALRRLEAGEMDRDDLDDDNLHLSPAVLEEKLLALRPPSEDLVVTHGDACMPNILSSNGEFTGFVDCGRLGIADRHQDLALACRDIADDLGEAWIGPFLDHYGAPLDEAKARFYRLLDEFF